jgi:hypothetical protein
MKRFMALLVALSPFVGCYSNDKSKGEPQREWLCGESTACDCRALKPGWTGSMSGVPVDRCTGYSCCLFDEQDTESTTANCRCFDTSTSCEAEAASQSGVAIVAQCPPANEDHKPPTACAQRDESCRKEYLSQRGLEDCCDGTLCKRNTENVPVCQQASPAELELGRQCKEFAGAPELYSLRVVSPTVATSAGTFRFTNVRFVLPEVGPAGCLSGIRITLADATGRCSFELNVELRDGKLVVTQVDGYLDGCPEDNGSSFGVILGENPPGFAFTFDGLSCDGGLVVESYCVAGTFDWHLGGSAGGVTFEDQHLIVEGVACSPLITEACPSL